MSAGQGPGSSLTRGSPRPCTPSSTAKAKRALALVAGGAAHTRRPQSARNHDPDGRGARLLAHLRAARGEPLSEDMNASASRPQTGTGIRTDSHDSAAGDVVNMARCAERGEVPPLSLILRCLDSIQSLDLSSSGGDALLWMIAPVLRAAHDRLADTCRERLATRVEVDALRAKLEGLRMDVESEVGCWHRAEETAKTQWQDRSEAAEAFEAKANQVLRELEQVKSETLELRQNADEDLGTASELQIRADRRQDLEEQISRMSDEHQALEEKSDLDAKIEEATQQLAAVKEKLTEVSPEAKKYDDMSKVLDKREMETKLFEDELNELMAKLRRRKDKAKAKSS